MCVPQSAWIFSRLLKPTRHFFDKFITSASKLPRSFILGNPSKMPVKCQYKFLTRLIFLFSGSSCYLLTSERDEDRGRPFNSWGGGGGVDDFWSASFFFSSNLVGRIFFFLLNALQNIFFPLHFSAGFFFLKKVTCVYIYRMYLHLHCGYCCNSSIWS